MRQTIVRGLPCKLSDCYLKIFIERSRKGEGRILIPIACVSMGVFGLDKYRCSLLPRIKAADVV